MSSHLTVSLESVKERRDRVLELSELQRTLRSQVAEYQRQERLTVNQLAIRFCGHNKDHSTLAQFLSGQRSVCGGRVLDGISRVLGLDELRGRILANAEHLPDRYRGVSAYSGEAVSASFDLLETYVRNASTVTARHFAACFAPHKDVVSSVLLCNSEGVRELENTSVSAAISTLLNQDAWKERLSDVKKPSQAVLELRRIVQELHERGIIIKELAPMIGVSETSLRSSLRAELRDETAVRIAKRARRFMNKQPPDEAATIDCASDRVTRLRTMVDALVARLGSQGKLAKRVGRSRRTINRALRGAASEALFQAVFSRVEFLYGGGPSGAKTTQPAVSEGPASSSDGAAIVVTSMTVSEKKQELCALYGQIQRQLSGKLPVDRALGVVRSRLYDARHGRVPEKTLDAILEKARMYVRRSAARVSPAQPIVEAQPSTDQYGGETSPLGVRFILTPRSFTAIVGDPGREGIAHVRRLLEMSRKSLNYLAQLKDDNVREQVRIALGAEVEETFLALQIFSYQYPNRLLKLYEGQRLTWASEGPLTKQPKGRR